MNKLDYLTGEELSAAQTLELIEEALVQKKETAEGKLRTTLAGKNFALLFEKHSTRTRVSFEAGSLSIGRERHFPWRRTIRRSPGGKPPRTAQRC